MNEDIIGIVGSASDKFTSRSELKAKEAIENIIFSFDISYTTIVSGESPLGGIDLWAHEIAVKNGYDFHAFQPKINSWNPPYGGYGFKARNLDIAKSRVVFVIIPNEYPPNYKGMRFRKCYHCDVDTHIKSGGCWTARQAIKIGNSGEWIIIKQEDV